jgi:N-acetylmuramoyl-L-alanine amidase
MSRDVPLMAEGDEQFFLEGNYFHPAKKYSRRPKNKYVAIHCSDTPATLDIGVDVIREWHIKERHWTDVGYHFVIKRDGIIQRGRPVWAIGAGIAGHNDEAIHVCLVGGRSVSQNREERRHPIPADNFTVNQKGSLKFLVANLVKHVAPGALVKGHGQFEGVTKACPSFDARAWWEKEAKDAMANYAQDGKVFP